MILMTKNSYLPSKDGNISPEKAKRAAQLSFDKYCSVSKSLDPNIIINQTIVVNGKQV